MLLSAPVRPPVGHGLDEVDQVGGALVNVVLAERLALHGVELPIDLGDTTERQKEAAAAPSG